MRRDIEEARRRLSDILVKLERWRLSDLGGREGVIGAARELGYLAVDVEVARENVRNMIRENPQEKPQ